jgi:starch synthase
MEILHVSAECYPVAKAGGLGDVVGALPRYQNELGHIAKVVMPMYRTKFLLNHTWETVHKGGISMGPWWMEYTVIKEKTNILGFDLYLVDINGLLDREKVYGYEDDSERFTAFQIAVVDWLSKWLHKPDVIHIHDHHTGLIPFMIKNCFAYQHLSVIPTVLTVHNAQYQGWMEWSKSNYLPAWDSWKAGEMDWQDRINPLASAIKCSWKVTTVSPSYLWELRESSNGLEKLFEFERGKCSGILNGIDVEVWDPATDKYLNHHFDTETVEEGKANNKKALCDTFQLDENKPLFVFIGRLVGEKAADILARVIGDSFYHIGRRMNFLVLGSGEPQVESELNAMKSWALGDYNTYIGYNEALSHQMYAGADFLLMPSRVEPCGLNQMYALRYGTMPLVRKTGGLKDTVVDMGDPGGYGITFNNATVGDVTQGIYRAVELFHDKDKLAGMRSIMMNIDNSWESSAKHYVELYSSLKH